VGGVTSLFEGKGGTWEKRSEKNNRGFLTLRIRKDTPDPCSKEKTWNSKLKKSSVFLETREKGKREKKEKREKRRSVDREHASSGIHNPHTPESRGKKKWNGCIPWR